MANTEKKRYWLKLDKDFLKSPQIKVIKNMPNGKDYIIYYLSLLLESLDKVGHLRFSDLVPYNEEMLASVTDTNVDIVRSANKMFMTLGLMEVLDDGTIFMTQVAEMTGKECESAERVRLYRQKQKEKILLQCNDDVTESNDNKEKKKEKEKQRTEKQRTEKQRTENKEQRTDNNKQLECVSVSDEELSNFFKTYEIEDFESRNIIIRYLNGGMEFEVIKNGLLLPYNRNVMGFDFEEETTPIDDPLAYGFTVLENWYNFGVLTMEDVKKYNKLNRYRTQMLGSDNITFDNSP